MNNPFGPALFAKAGTLNGILAVAPKEFGELICTTLVYERDRGRNVGRFIGDYERGIIVVEDVNNHPLTGQFYRLDGRSQFDWAKR